MPYLLCRCTHEVENKHHHMYHRGMPWVLWSVSPPSPPWRRLFSWALRIGILWIQPLKDTWLRKVKSKKPWRVSQDTLSWVGQSWVWVVTHVGHFGQARQSKTTLHPSEGKWWTGLDGNHPPSWSGVSVVDKRSHKQMGFLVPASRRLWMFLLRMEVQLLNHY